MRIFSKMHGLSCIKLGWALAALLQYATLLVGADQAGRTDLLLGNNHESSCDLAQSIHQKCGTQAPGLDKTPITSLCTCNNVFFNIWSACSYASGNNTLPVYSQWLDTCEHSTIDVVKSSLMTTEQNALGISVPVWAWMDIPGNTSFDLQKAVVAVHAAPKPWSVVQIILPAAAAIVAALLTAICLVLRRRKNVKQGIKEYLIKLKPVPKVRPVDEQQFGEWVIEQPLPMPQNGGFIPPQQREVHLHRGEAPAPIHYRHSDSTVPGHPSIPSTGLLGSVVVFDHTAQNPSAVPGGRVWPEGVIPPSPVNQSYPFSSYPNQQQSGSNTKSTTPASSGKWRVRNVRMPKPWKPRPVQIREKKPGKGFRLDGSTEESTSVGQRSSSGHGDNPENLRGSFDIRRHEDDAEDLFDEPLAIDEEHSEDEATGLMTDEQRTSYQRSSYLGVGESPGMGRFSGNTGTVNSSSIDSHVRVIPPSTTSSDSQRNTMISRPASRYLPPPIVPPAPRQPAPVPPAMPARVPLRDLRAMNNIITNSLNTQLTASNQASNMIRQMTPIQEIEIRSNSPSLSELYGIARRPSDPRPLPIPNTPPHGQLSFGAGVVGVANSAFVSSSSVYEEHHSRGSSTHAHLRQNSGDSVRSTRPLPTPAPGRNPSLSSLSNQRYLSPSREDLGSDYFATTGSSAQGSPHHGVHQRILGSDESDDASFYVRSPPAQPHQLLSSPPNGPLNRTMSPPGLNRTPPGGDPPIGLLFPASVRGAGYRGSPGL